MRVQQFIAKHAQARSILEIRILLRGTKTEKHPIDVIFRGEVAVLIQDLQTEVVILFIFEFHHQQLVEGL